MPSRTRKHSARRTASWVSRHMAASLWTLQIRIIRRGEAAAAPRGPQRVVWLPGAMLPDYPSVTSLCPPSPGALPPALAASRLGQLPGNPDPASCAFSTLVTRHVWEPEPECTQAFWSANSPPRVGASGVSCVSGGMKGGSGPVKARPSTIRIHRGVTGLRSQLCVSCETGTGSPRGLPAGGGSIQGMPSRAGRHRTWLTLTSRTTLAAEHEGSVIRDPQRCAGRTGIQAHFPSWRRRLHPERKRLQKAARGRNLPVYSYLMLL